MINTPEAFAEAEMHHQTRHAELDALHKLLTYPNVGHTGAYASINRRIDYLNTTCPLSDYGLNECEGCNRLS